MVHVCLVGSAGCFRRGGERSKSSIASMRAIRSGPIASRPYRDEDKASSRLRCCCRPRRSPHKMRIAGPILLLPAVLLNRQFERGFSAKVPMAERRCGRTEFSQDMCSVNRLPHRNDRNQLSESFSSCADQRSPVQWPSIGTAAVNSGCGTFGAPAGAVISIVVSISPLLICWTQLVGNYGRGVDVSRNCAGRRNLPRTDATEPSKPDRS